MKKLMIEKGLEEYEQGKVTLWEAAEKCGLSLREIVLEAKKRKITVPYTIDEFQEDLKALDKNANIRLLK